MVYIGNAFSLQMICSEKPSVVKITRVDKTALIKYCHNDMHGKHGQESLSLAGESIIGHADTAACLTKILGVPVPMNRKNISLSPGDVLFVAQVTGGRLPEGIMMLPEGTAFVFLKVEVICDPTEEISALKVFKAGINKILSNFFHSPSDDGVAGTFKEITAFTGWNAENME